MSSPTHTQGFTLIELLICIAILAILTSVAAPGFSELRMNTVRSASINDLWHGIFLARSEAIKRNSVVVMCKSPDGLRCDNAPGNWARGWIVFDNLDRDEPAQVDSGEPVLRRFNASSSIHIRSNPNQSSPGRQTFAFRPFAQGSVNGTLVFCDARGGSAARAIIISHTGRPRHSQRDANNKPLTCSQA